MTMTYDDYMKRVLSGDYPETPIVPLPPKPFFDERGVIQNLFLHDASSISLIMSHRGSVRANHYHKDWHFSYLISGKLAYYERNIGDKNIEKPLIIDPGTLFFTPPMKEHSMLFLEESIFLTFQNSIRTHENHEDSVTRVEYIPQGSIFKNID